MKTNIQAAALASLCVIGSLHGQTQLADLFDEDGMDMADDLARARLIERMTQIENERRAIARAKAAAAGLAQRLELPNGRVIEIADFRGIEPIYLSTNNLNAAISTGARELQSSPFQLDGNGQSIGMWDGGSGRSSHQEFGGRMIVKDGSASIDHATHVGGTLIASGVVANAKGMAPSATVDSYDWNNDLSEMTSRAATAPSQHATRIYVSNHSYGYITGWNYTGGSGSPARTWEWYGNGTTAADFEQDYGRYNTYSREIDVLAYNAPYYLIFQSAGNDRADNPASGQSVALAPGSSTVVSYNPSLHPAGDGTYRTGFETVAFRAVAKNLVTIGSVNDAVTSGVRDSSKASMSNFSCWGPTDDGRIKPDLVANGAGVYSSMNSSNTGYATLSGTSMSSPNACGTAALLVQQYSQLTSGGAMRAASLKGLLIHTADDLGNVGPDYKTGWGLINAKAAGEFLNDHHANPLKGRLTESEITSTTNTLSFPFVWDQISPIRATLSWTDPAGTATTSSDLRSPRLVNNLQLKLVAPDGTEHLPYVMPFVGTWTAASMDLAASNGINNTDNVEQVRINNPNVSGTWQAIVTYSGTLTNNIQTFSLLLDGSTAEPPPPPPVALSSVSPSSGLSGTIVSLSLSGAGLGLETQIRMRKSGNPDLQPINQSLNGADLICQFDLDGASTGAWDLVAENPDGSSATRVSAFTIIGAIWSESFDASPSGWVSQATLGNNTWILESSQSHTPPQAYSILAPATKSTSYLNSPGIPIPPSANNLQFKFWHAFQLESARDAGRLEFSIDQNTWFSAGAINSGTAFASNGYNSVINTRGKPSDQNEFGGEAAWSGDSGGFVESVVNLTDTAKFAGNTLWVRWCLSTNNSKASPGWIVDSISLIGDADLSNQPPTITSAATSSSSESEVDAVDGSIWIIERGSSANLSVGASDEGGSSALKFTWNVVGPAPVYINPNGSNLSSTTSVEFEQSGDYIATVTVTDESGLAASSSCNLRVLQTSSALVVSPAAAVLSVGQSQNFSATLNDQFGSAMASQPASLEWTAAGGGLIDTLGNFTASAAGGPFAITASSGDFTDFASITVNPAPAVIELSGLSQTYDGLPKQVTVSTVPSGLAYQVLYNGSTTAPSAIGSYEVSAEVVDINYQGSASGTLIIEASNNFASWQVLNFTEEQILNGTAADLADPDGDGLANLAEFALGTNPWQHTPLPHATLDDLGLNIVFTRPSGLPDVSYAAESSINLNDWLPAVLETVASSDGVDTVRARASAELGDPKKQFIRLRFSRQ
ncbi:MAG: S8 family serine peptidase [Luteolibacter sp.]